MKKLLTIFTLVFTVMFSSTCYAGWTKVREDAHGNTFYVDFERIRKHGGFVYFWLLSDYLKPIFSGTMSGKTYHQGDCKLFRFKTLHYVHHKQSMGRDVGEGNSPKNPDWRYPHPNSVIEEVLKSVCSR